VEEVHLMFVNKILRKYSLLLEVQPIKTRCITTAVTMGVGDTISQLITKQKDEKWDKWRTARMSFVGFSLMGPCLYFWHRMLERKTIKYGISGTKGVVGKVIIDQLIYAPSMLASVLISLGLLEGRTKEQIFSSLSTSYFPILRTNYLFWPFVVMINFR
jgi:protein Mpv17